MTESVRAVTIGKFIAFFVDWEVDVAQAKRQEFWVGKVINITDTTVTVHYYHTGQKSGSNYKRAVFKPWTGKNKKVHVGRDAVIHVFERLTESGMLKAKHRNFILNRVKQGRTVGRSMAVRQEEDDEDEDDDEDYVVSDISEDDDDEDQFLSLIHI